jgi:Holliday junction resolvase RusA-like endonuclease
MSAPQLPIRLTLRGDPRTKKNSQRLIVAGGKTKPLPSKAFTQWQETVGWQIPGNLRNAAISVPVNIKAIFFMQTRRPVDKVGLEQGLQDMLVHYGVIADDNRDIVAAMDGSRVYWDKANPRVEIEITAIAGEYEQWQGNPQPAPDCARRAAKRAGTAPKRTAI